jgi:hypothetical protein
MMAGMLFVFFRYCLHQSTFGSLHWLMVLWLTGLFPFQFFTPALFNSLNYQSIAYISIGLRAMGLLLIFFWFQTPEIRSTSIINMFYFFPVTSIVLGSILAFQVENLKYFLACNDAIMNGFLALNAAVFSFLPLPSFGITALALALILFIASSLSNQKEVNHEYHLLGLFYYSPYLTFVWIIGFLVLSGIFPIGYSWQWRLLSVFYAWHRWWILGPLLVAIIILSCAYFRWIYAAIKPYDATSGWPVYCGSRAQLALAMVVSLLLCLSWVFSFYGS